MSVNMNQPVVLLFVLFVVREIRSCIYCGPHPFSSILPPLPPLPNSNFGFRPYIPPIRPFIPPLPPLPQTTFGFRPYIPPLPPLGNRPEPLSPFEFGHRKGCQISPSFRTLDINDDLVMNVTESVRDWRYDLISDFMQDLLAEQTIQSEFNSVESAIPPDSFILAMISLTTEQKAHITELALRGDSLTLTRIMDGIILSLPEEIQAQSIRFTRLLSDILCYSAVNDREKSLIESLLG